MKLKKTEIETELKHYKEISQQIKALEKLQADLKKTLIASYFEKHPEYTDKQGVTLATYTTSIRQLFDTKRFKEEQPNIYTLYVNEQEVKTFLVK